MSSARTVRRLLAVGSLAAALRAFFLPWVVIDVNDVALAQGMGGGATALERLSDALPAPSTARIVLTVRQGDRTLTSDLGALAKTAGNVPRVLTGAELPRVVHADETRLILSVLAMAMRLPRELDRRINAVYLVPGLAVILGAALLLWDDHRWVASAVSLLACGVAGVGWWKLLSVPASVSTVSVTIREGLWVSLGAYAGLAAAGIWASYTGARY